MVNVLVLGGTGPTGLAIINEALSRGYTVIIYARSPQKLPPEITTHPSVIIVAGALEDEEAISRCFTIHRTIESSELDGDQSQAPKKTEAIHIDAVVSALGPPVTGIHPSGNPLAKGYERFIRIGKQYGVNRFIVLGTASIKDEFDKFDLRFKTLVFGVQTFAPHAFGDIIAIGKLFDANEGVDWTIARVPVLVSRDGKEYYSGYIGDGKTTTVLTRSLFARFVCDEVETPKWIRERPMISWLS